MPTLPIPGPVADIVTGAIDAAFLGFFTASQELIKFVFKSVDNQSVFSLTATPGGSAPSLVVGSLWPLTMWIGGSLALILAAWQIISALLRGRGGAEVGQSLVGLAQFALVTGAIIVVVQTVNLACDATSIAILDAGLSKPTFKAAGQDLFQTVETAAAAVLMLVFGIVGILGAVVLWVEFAFRQLAVIALVISAPIAAAGLVSGTTRGWFPTMAKWTLAALVAKPAIALVLVIAVKMLSAGDGLAGLLAGTTALVVATMMPWAMLRLFSFVEAGGSGRGSGHRATTAAAGTAGGAVSGRVGGRSGASGAEDGAGGGDAPSSGGGSPTQTATQTRMAGASAGGGGGAPSPFRRAAAMAAAGGRRVHGTGAYLADGFGDFMDKNKTGDPDWRGDSAHLHRARPHHAGRGVGPAHFPPPTPGGAAAPAPGGGGAAAGGGGSPPGGGAAPAPAPPPPPPVVPV